MEKRRRFTAEFKREAIRLLKAARKPAAVLARELGVPRNRLYKWAQDAGLIASMSRKGMPYDNAVMESFFSTLKQELTHHEQFTDRDEARSKIFDYIEVFYNRRRLHSSLNNQSPEQFEKNIAV